MALQDALRYHQDSQNMRFRCNSTQGERTMTKDEVSARLRALATDDKRRSETARLRDVFDDVEATLNAGVTQADVLAELHALGFTMTMASFKSALQRIRKERAGDRPARRSATPAPAPLGHDQTPGETAPAAPATDKKAGGFEIPVPKRFTHNPKPDDDLLK
ncbi:hypothetical protein OMN91_004480 [Salmonella enterica subsp. enterica serovar Derby]|nr:hypothetical protein [Salmonella enterica subsp. enterica serovar Derby]EKK3062410.1 hypothetical protein [Salmonella enterica]